MPDKKQLVPLSQDFPHHSTWIPGNRCVLQLHTSLLSHVLLLCLGYTFCPLLHLASPSSFKTLLIYHLFKKASSDSSKVWIRSQPTCSCDSPACLCCDTSPSAFLGWLPTHLSSPKLCSILKRGMTSFIFIFQCLVPCKYAGNVC